MFRRRSRAPFAAKSSTGTDGGVRSWPTTVVAAAHAVFSNSITRSPRDSEETPKQRICVSSVGRTIAGPPSAPTAKHTFRRPFLLRRRSPWSAQRVLPTAQLRQMMVGDANNREFAARGGPLPSAFHVHAEPNQTLLRRPKRGPHRVERDPTTPCAPFGLPTVGRSWAPARRQGEWRVCRFGTWKPRTGSVDAPAREARMV